MLGSNKDGWVRVALELNGSWRAAGEIVGLPATMGDTTVDASMLLNVSRFRELARTYTRETMEDVSVSNQWACRWGQYGFPTFNLTHSLTAALLLTDCSGVKGEDLRWPFPSFLVHLPSTPSFISYHASDGKTVLPARYLMVHRYRARKPGYQEFPREHLSASTSTISSVRAMRDYGASIEASGGYEPWSFIAALGDSGETVHSRDRLPLDGEPLESWLSTEVGRESQLPMTARDSNETKAMCRLVANLMLYVAGLEADKKLPRFRPPEVVGTEYKVHEITLGSEVKLPRELRDAAREYAERGRSDTHRAAWKVRSRFSVRGHWRNQPVGPKGEGRTKRLWIQPFWKGPETAAIVSRVYQTGTASAETGEVKCR